MLAKWADWRWLIFIIAVVVFALLKWDVSYVNSIGIFLLLSGQRIICRWMDLNG